MSYDNRGMSDGWKERRPASKRPGLENWWQEDVCADEDVEKNGMAEGSGKGVRIGWRVGEQ